MRTSDFSLKTKRLLAQRVGYLCSNPECRALTCGPCEQTDKSVTAGDAAHITAASAGGPRFDASLNSEKRCAYDNGIWLCVHHARVVDQNDSGHSVELLRTWKRKAEDHAAERLGKPRGPAPLVSQHVRRYVMLARSVLAGLRVYTQDSLPSGLERPLRELETLASSLALPIPIEIRTIPYPVGVVAHNPFLQDRFEGTLTIRFPDGSYESGKAAHASGLEMLIESRESAIVALEQWVFSMENGAPLVDSQDEQSDGGV